MITRTTSLARQLPGIRVIGASDAIQRVAREALQAARWEANVLITGERGAGKAAIARFIHEQSDRSPYGFATVRCEGLPDLLFESALFGHVQGSFPGAYRDKPGLLESSTGGTILLDEVGALSMRTQARLLRYLETGECLRIGGNPIQVQPWRNVRVIATTARDLQALVAAGVFLSDLYDRLTVLQLSVPPLRERRGDIPSLIDHFAAQFAERRLPRRPGAPAISSAVRDALSRADWPGNVGELKDVVSRQQLMHLSAGTPVRRRA